MPWLETTPVEERIQFIGDALSDRFNMSELCARYGISRRVGYKWLARYRAEGAAGLFDRSRAPLTHPQEVSGAVMERCLAVRREHPSWGPRKVRAFLERRAPEMRLPAASTLVQNERREQQDVQRSGGLKKDCVGSGREFRGGNEQRQRCRVHESRPEGRRVPRDTAPEPHQQRDYGNARADERNLSGGEGFDLDSRATGRKQHCGGNCQQPSCISLRVRHQVFNVERVVTAVLPS